MYKLLYLSFIALSFSFGQLKNVAVLDFIGKGISAEEASIIADSLRSELVKSKSFVVLDRGNMQKVLAEQSFQNSGCTDTACAVEMGRLLNMQLMVVGTLSKLGSLYSLTIEMINVETGVIESSEQETTPALEGMFVAVKSIASKLAIQQGGLKTSQVAQPTSQVKSNKGVKAGFATVGVLSLAGGAAFNVLGYLKVAEINNIGEQYQAETESSSKAASLYEDYLDLQSSQKMQYILAGGCYGFGAIMTLVAIVIPNEKKVKSVAVVPLYLKDGAGLLLTARF